MSKPVLKTASRTNQQDFVEQLIADWRVERPDLDVSAMAIVGRVLLLARKFDQRANAALKQYRLNYTDFDVLATLRRSGDPFALSPTKLRNSVLITSGAMTTCLDRLERNKLIKRQNDPNDRRAIIVVLSVRGLILIEKALATRFAEADESVEGLSKTEFSALEELLKKLCVQHSEL